MVQECFSSKATGADAAQCFVRCAIELQLEREKQMFLSFETAFGTRDTVNSKKKKKYQLWGVVHLVTDSLKDTFEPVILQTH